jgi:predicted O-methyltransferase YrrM
VEIGTAHGAATIALALGARESGRPFRVYTVDPFSGKYSSRTRFGSVEENVAFVRQQFRSFGVDEHITLVVGDSRSLVQELGDQSSVGFLLIDADGRIDRDLELLFDRLDEDAVIVIDDIDDKTFIHQTDGRMVVDQKHRIAYLLTAQLLNQGFLTEQVRIGGTGFYAKGKPAASAARIAEIALSAYRELVFADVARPKQRRTVRSWMANNVPLARSLYRTMRSAVGRAPSVR